MLRLPVALLTVAALAALPSTAAAACRDGAHIVRSQPKGSNTVRTAVVVCADGRSRVVRRAVLRNFYPRRGTYLSDAALNRGRLAIGSITFTGHHDARNVVQLQSLRTGRSLFRRATREQTNFNFQAVEVVVSDDGDLAWNIDRRLSVRRATGEVERLPVPGGPQLALEDGRTLRWRTSFAYAYFDLRPIPGDGCPRRRRFRPAIDAGGVLVTAATYEADEPTMYTVLRACVRGSGRDVVLGTGWAHDDDASLLDVAAASAPFALVTRHAFGKYDGCHEARIATVDLRTGRTVREAVSPGGDLPDPSCPLEPRLPRRGDPSVFTAGGGAAWLRDGVLSGLDGARRVVELDRGAIANLRADGNSVRWTRDGVERSALL